ncbi:hypothetical protein Smp_002860 [Schistosoma mansoni]|uniref:DUF3074 domain-containing protein n=1 Tax=Schistosoma mansoni TaxID=6183 RepID=G4VLJ2_SCHMA|nr:hypothetical protein Smp_002860 [Schistosoma mansoni]|eukprot:XP_018652946.1 hypothetical protein Smp_002860 [Schistosoma mansoni]
MSTGNHKNDQIPELSPHYSETRSDDDFGGNSYRTDLLLQVEFSKVRLAQTERGMELEWLRQKGGEHYNEVAAKKIWTVERLSMLRRMVPTTPQIASWSHLLSVTLPRVGKEDVEVLVVFSVHVAHETKEKRVGKSNDPYAIITPLGLDVVWALQ